jgi:hypothetical protein
LKGVTFRLHNREEVTLILRKEGEGPVTAADIQTPHDVEVINPEHVICNLAHGGKIDMQIKVEKGRGYVPGSLRRFGDEPTKAIGRIVLDASFSPVRRVSYAVENARAILLVGLHVEPDAARDDQPIHRGNARHRFVNLTLATRRRVRRDHVDVQIHRLAELRPVRRRSLVAVAEADDNAEVVDRGGVAGRSVREPEHRRRRPARAARVNLR